MPKNLAPILKNYDWFCVGSLPYKSAAAAADFVLGQRRILPFWPELPNLSPREFSLTKGGRALSASWAGLEEDEAAGLYEIAARLKARGERLPVFKVQLLGPISLAAYSEEIAGSFSQKLPAAGEAVMRQINWLSRFCSEFSDGLVMQLDEPGFAGWAMLSEEERRAARELISYIYVSEKDLKVWSAIHSCARLSPEFFSLAADLFSFDPAYLPECMRDARSLAARATKGAIFVPGFYPASGAGAEDLVSASAARESRFWEGEWTVHSASCGHAGADESLVRALYSAV